MAEELAPTITRVASKPGIKRDGTRLEGEGYIDGLWTRFQRGLPRKIGGYRSINKYLRGLVRELNEFTANDLTYIHAGSSEFIERLYIDADNNTSVITDRTPTAGFTVDDANLWQFAVAARLNAGTWTNKIIAQVAPNLDDICNDDAGAIFAGDLLGTSALTSVALPTGGIANGGIVAVHPYLFFFGNDGYIGWSIAGDPTNLSGSGSGAVNAARQKVLRGMPLRGGGGNSPAALFWTADALIRATFVGGAAVFAFDTITGQSSLLSSRSVIEYNGIYFWPGTDSFLMFNGVIREVPNDMNINDFFDNLNYRYRQKIFAFKVPRFGEIWWCYPRGTSTEPNHAIIYNVRENTWYDTALPNGGRGAGLSPSIYRYPILTGVVEQTYTAIAAEISDDGTGYTAGDILTATGGEGLIDAQVEVETVDGSGQLTAVNIVEAGSYTETPTNPVAVTGGTGTDAELDLTFSQPYKLWIHEIGVDEIDGQNQNAIRAYIETGEIALPVDKGINRAMQTVMLEPDFVQAGAMTVRISGRWNARAATVTSDPYPIPETASTPSEQVVHFKDQRRLLSLIFESNVVGGDFQMGVPLLHVKPGDGTAIG